MAGSNDNRSTEKGYRVSGPGSMRTDANISVYLKHSGAVVAEPLPDPAGTDITGSWEGTTCTVRINRAGRRIEGWHTDYRSKVVTAFGGDFGDGPEVAQLWAAPAYAQNVGSLQVTADNEIALHWSGASQLLIRVGRNPTISDNALQAFDPAQQSEIINDQRQSLLTSERDMVIRGLSSPSLGPFIERYTALSSDATAVDRNARALVVQDMDRMVRGLFQRLHPQDVPKARPWAQYTVARTQYTCNGRTQSLIHWLQEMVQVATALSNDPAPSLRENLNISPGSELHHYLFELEIRNLRGSDADDFVKAAVSLGKSLRGMRFGLGGGYFAGTLRVHRLSYPDKDASRIWTQQYPIAGAQLGVGLGISFGSDNDSVVSTAFPWETHHFPGPFKLIDLSAGAFNRALGATGFFLRGNGAFPELAIDFSGLGQNWGASAGFAEAIGAIGPAGSTGPTPISIPEETEYGTQTSQQEIVYFPFGKSEVTDRGRQQLRLLAAQELALFRSGRATLEVTSHADTVDTRSYNLILTKCRSWNVYQALRDILGAGYHHATTHQLYGMGEEISRTETPDNVSTSYWRRSEIYINGRLVLRLRGEGRPRSP